MADHLAHWDPAVRELVARAWDEGANAAIFPHNTGTRMTLRAVIPFPENPYRAALADPEVQL